MRQSSSQMLEAGLGWAALQTAHELSWRSPTRARVDEIVRDGSDGETRIIRSGLLVVELSLANGLVMPLARLAAGDVLPNLANIINPAFSINYRAEQLTHIGWLPRDADQESHQKSELTRNALLAASLRLVVILVCLPATYRLYVELLRSAMASAGEAFRLLSHAGLAARTCTTRETISRELSLLRRDGVLSEGKDVHLLKPDDLLCRLANMFHIDSLEDVIDYIIAPENKFGDRKICLHSPPGSI